MRILRVFVNVHGQTFLSTLYVRQVDEDRFGKRFGETRARESILLSIGPRIRGDSGTQRVASATDSRSNRGSLKYVGGGDIFYPLSQPMLSIPSSVARDRTDSTSPRLVSLLFRLSFVASDGFLPSIIEKFPNLRLATGVEGDTASGILSSNGFHLFLSATSFADLPPRPPFRVVDPIVFTLDVTLGD